MEKFKLKENQKLLTGGIFLFIAMLAIVGYTYSFFQIEDKDTTTITGTVASASLEIEVNKLAPSTNKGLVPQLDDYITAAVVERNNLNCVDDNSNEVCQVYSIKVTNTGSSSINVDGLVELNANNNPNLKWAEISTYTQGVTTRPELKSNVKTHSETDLTTNELY